MVASSSSAFDDHIGKVVTFARPKDKYRHTFLRDSVCVGQLLLCVHTPVPFSIHMLLTFTLQKEAKAFLSAKLEWFPPHRHGINAMQRTEPGTENILKHLWFGFLSLSQTWESFCCWYVAERLFCLQEQSSLKCLVKCFSAECMKGKH